MAADGTDIVKRYDRLVNEASTFRDRWERMAPYIAPSRLGMFTSPVPGQKQTGKLYDSTTLMAAELMAQFIAGHIISPSQRWLDYRMREPTLNADDEVREWLEECRDRFLDQVASSLFYAEGPESLIDYVGFGTGLLFVEELPQPPNLRLDGFRGFHFRAERTGRFVIAEGADGLVDTVMREMWITARVFGDLWGSNLPESIQNAQRDQPDKAFKVVHAVLPRPFAEQGAGALGMPWASVWVAYDAKHVLRESGYRIFPCAVPRYTKTPGEVYGRGRGDIAFPDAWSLNTAKQMGFEDWALKIRPPVLQAHNSVIGTLKLVPAGPMAVNTHGKAIKDVIMPFETGSNPQVSQIKEEELRKSIRDIFYVDAILQLLETHKSEMTAFEFARKIELLFRLLGPVYGRLEWEYLHRIADIGFDLMFHAGAFPPPPTVLAERGGNVVPVFQNPIARAQRAGDAEALLMVVNDLAPLAQIIPQVWDHIDPDATAEGILATRGFPARWTRDDRAVAALRNARQEQNARELQLNEAQGVAEAVGRVTPMMKTIMGRGTRP